MKLTPRRDAPKPVRDDELHVLFTRIPDPSLRPLPTDEEIDAFEPVDECLHATVGDYVEPFLGPASSTFRDTQFPFPVDLRLIEPGDGRPWGACFTVGASAHAMPTSAACPSEAPKFVELFLRLPRSAFRYWENVVLEPFDDLHDAAVNGLGELGRLPHEQRVCYRAPQIVATRDLSPLVAGLPFAGALLRDASTGTVAVPALPMLGGGTVTFLAVTFLHASEVQALTGPDRARAAARFAESGVDELFVAGRGPVM